MKKYNIYILLLFLILVVSCQKNDPENGLFFAKYESGLSFDEAYIKSKNMLYRDLAEFMSSSVDRNDYAIIAGFLSDNNIIDFDNAQIDRKEKKDKFIIKIKVKDKTLFDRSFKALESIKKEGILSGAARAFATINLPEVENLSAYTRSTIERNTLSKANESLYKLLIKEGFGVNLASYMTNSSYIIEESYSETEYTVIIESDLK